MNPQYAPIGLYRLCTPLLFLLNPEKAHKMSLKALHWSGKIPLMHSMMRSILAPPSKPYSFLGHTIPNRIGMAAGYDKNACALDGLEAMGFGHIEVGTITPKPQKGNPTPRIHRLKKESALVNRLGFPNDGVDIIAKRIEIYRTRQAQRHDCTNQQLRSLLGINIGRNKSTSNADAASDYVQCFERLCDYGDYIAINISSPNTPNLRALQNKNSLEDLLVPLLNARAKKTNPVPFFVKLSPDVSAEQRAQTLHQLVDLGIEGVILSNTQKTQTPWEGGKSGAGLHQNTYTIIKEAKKETPKLRIIASGGIGMDGDTERFCTAGADLIQIWTALIYRGPQLLRRL
jgi:dihydroorotate dehydrogenase